MTKIMTPSVTPMTDGQIDKAVAHYRDALKKRRDDIGGSEEVQRVLGSDGYINEIVGVLRRHVAMVSNIIRRVVKVDRTKTAAEIIDATGRVKWYIDEEVLAEMPLDGREEDTVEFFELDYDPTVDELDREYEARGLRPDLVAVAQAMTDDPAFTDERSVAVQWRDSQGRTCFAVFNRDVGERYVSVYRFGIRWHRLYRFAGVRK
jgi:hypothetical protein